MYGRDFTRSLGNVANIDALVRNNKHYRNLYIYGFEQIYDIDMLNRMAFGITIEATLIVFITVGEIYNAFGLNIDTAIEKYIKANLYQSFMVKAEAVMEKMFKLESRNSIMLNIHATISTYINMERENYSAFTWGTLYLGKYISEIENLTIEEIMDITVEQLTKGKDDIYGLDVALIRPFKIIDIQDLYISDIQDKLVDDITHLIIE